MKKWIKISICSFFLLIFTLIATLPGTNEKQVTIRFDSAKFAYNSFKKFSYFPVTCYVLTFFYPFGDRMWIIPEKCSFFNFLRHIYEQEPINDIKKITFKEGINVKQSLDLINNSTELSGDKIDNILEGSIFPDTYFFKKGTSRKNFFLTIQKKSKKHLQKIWNTRKENFELSFQEWIILASIIQKESAKKKK